MAQATHEDVTLSLPVPAFGIYSSGVSLGFHLVLVICSEKVEI